MANPGVGIMEGLIVLFVFGWQIGLPLAAAYCFFRLWQRLHAIEQTVVALRAELQQKR